MTVLLAPPSTSPTAADCCVGLRTAGPCDFRLRLVEYDDGVEVHQLECDACGRVTYR